MADVITEAGRIHLRWALVDGVGPLTFGRIMEKLGDPAAALGASAAALQTVPGIGPKIADAIARSRDDGAAATREIEAAETHGVRIICRADDDYPPGLRQIPDAPLVLYVKGELRATDAIAVAVVGSRRCTIYGSEQARRFGELLAGVGVTVVSGLARGVDAFAHHGAVEAGGRSIAAMGRGLTEVYPPENQALAEKLLDHGAWLTELPLHAAVRAENFPGRNRIIAGMTLGTLVIEAAQRSGALITARFASEYNREVFALPGRATDALSQGTNKLIRDGAAKLVTCLEDVLDELGEVGARLRAGTVDAVPATASADTARKLSETSGAPGPGLFESAAAPSGLSTVEAKVLTQLDREPVLQDAVLRAADVPVGEALAALTALELKGLVQRLPGNLIRRRV